MEYGLEQNYLIQEIGMFSGVCFWHIELTVEKGKAVRKQNLYPQARTAQLTDRFLIVEEKRQGRKEREPSASQGDFLCLKNEGQVISSCARNYTLW